MILVINGIERNNGEVNLSYVKFNSVVGYGRVMESIEFGVAPPAESFSDTV